MFKMLFIPVMGKLNFQLLLLNINYYFQCWIQLCCLIF